MCALAARMESQTSAMHKTWKECGDKDACGLGDPIIKRHGTSVLAGLVEDSEAAEHEDYLLKAVEADKAVDAIHPASLIAAARSEGIDFLFQITKFYEVSRDTVGSCITVMDKFLSRACSISNCNHLFENVGALCRNPALLSTICFCIMCKYRETVCPLLQDLSEHVLHGKYTVGDIRIAENVLLTLIDWDIHSVTAVEICSEIMKADPTIFCASLQEDAMQIAEIAACTGKMLGYSTASIAVCSILLAAERRGIPSGRVDAILPECLLSRVNIAGGVDLLRTDMPAVYSLEHEDDRGPHWQSDGSPQSTATPAWALEPRSDETFEAESLACPDAVLHAESYPGSITVTCEVHAVIVVPASPESTGEYSPGYCSDDF